MKLKISIDNKSYDVDVEVAEEERPSSGPYYYTPPSAPVSLPSALPPPPAVETGGGTVDETKVCRSPIAGIVVRINSRPGQQIQANDALIVLEAMKMETNITSPVSGKVKSIHATVGEGVKIGQVVVEFE